jgi:hypothetical protein
MAKELRRLADGKGERDKEQAKKLYDMAQKQLEQMTPEQREQARKMAEDFARGKGNGGPGFQRAPVTRGPQRPLREGPTTPVDARQPATVSGNEKPPERTVAEWYSDKPSASGARGAASDEPFKQAAQGAERAIERQEVPGRYQDLVRRVFKRYAEQNVPK